METATRRMAAQSMGTLPRYAAGGFIDGLKRAVGIKPDSPELKAYKERAAAERAGKPAVVAKPTTNAIASNLDGSAAAKRMKAVDAMATGGPVNGKGTGTSDEVPIMASNGEFVVRAAAVEEIGLPALRAINALGGNLPKSPNRNDDKYAEGDVIDSDKQKYANQTAMYIAGAQAANPPAPPSPAPAVAPVAPPAPQSVGSQVRSLADTYAPNTSDAVSSTISGAGNAFSKGQYAQGAGQLSRGGISTGISMLQDGMTPAFKVADTVGGAVADFGRGFMRQPATAPTPAAPPTPQAAMATAPAYRPAVDSQRANVQAPPRPGAPNPASGSPDEVSQDGKVNVTKQANGVMSFSGQNITGQPQYTGSAANTMKGGAMNTMQAMPQAEINRALTNPDGSRWSANDNAIMAANIRDGVNPYRGTSRGIAEAAQNDLMNLALSPNGTPGKGNAMKMLAMQSDDKRAAGQQQLEKDRNSQMAQLAQNKDGREAASSAMDQKARKQLMDAQDEYLNAKTPEEQKAAERKLMTLGNKQGKAPTFHPGSRIKNVDGSETVTPAYVFDPTTGEAREVNAGPAKTGGTQAPTTKAEYDKLPKGATYTHPDGTTRTKG